MFAAPMRLWLCAGALLAACAAPADVPGRTPVRPANPVVRALPEGSLLLLATPVAATVGELDILALQAWWQEAMRQSVRFDITAPDDGVSRAAATIELAVDLRASVLTATLQTDPPLPLASSTFAGRAMHQAVDELAVAVRQSLGEDLEQQPVPVAACLSSDPRAAHFWSDAVTALQDGAFGVADRALQQARRLDGASPSILDSSAALAALQGRAEVARRNAEEALGYKNRLAPPVMHRLARTLLLARASLHPDDGKANDEGLLLLADAGRRERPHDPQMLLSFAVAQDFLGRFDLALPVLRQLADRLPRSATTAYHLGWAEMQAGDAAAAVRAFDRAAPVLPTGATILPRALSRYAAGDHRGLEDFLTQCLADPSIADGDGAHAVRRIQAAHAILQNDAATARHVLLLDLAFLVQRPSLLETRAGELADQMQALVLLGGAAELRPHLAALGRIGASAALADAIAFGSGMCDIVEHGERATALEATLARNAGQDAWSNLLAAMAHREKGELREEFTALSTASRLSDSPLTKAALVRSLRAMGKVTEADSLREALRRELTEVHLRRRLQHPLLGPELALAYMVP